MAALTRRTLLAGLSATAALATGASVRRLAGAQHHDDAWADCRAAASTSARGSIADGLSRRLGQQIVVEPRPGRRRHARRRRKSRAPRPTATRSASSRAVTR